MRERIKPCPFWAESWFQQLASPAFPLHLQPALLSQDGVHLSDEVQEHSDTRSEPITIPQRDLQSKGQYRAIE